MTSLSSPSRGRIAFSTAGSTEIAAAAALAAAKMRLSRRPGKAEAYRRNMNAVSRHLPPRPKPVPNAPGMFAFADPQRVSEVLTAAGWVPPRLDKLCWKNPSISTGPCSNARIFSAPGPIRAGSDHE
jgi:hypothetical protein